jgi:hypothetical protein
MKKNRLRGACLGGCIEGVPVGSGYRAHAHISGEFRGWICFRSRNPPLSLILHEIAHVLSGCGHNRKWAETLISIGGTVEKRYRKLKGLRDLL